MNTSTNGIRRFFIWSGAHPVKAWGNLILFGTLGALIGGFLAFDNWKVAWGLVTISLFGLVVLHFSIAKDLKKLLSLILALSFTPALSADESDALEQFTPLPNIEEPQPSVIPVVVVVAVIGTVVYYALRRFCQQHFPKPPQKGTNAAPWMALSPASVGDDYAATWVFVGWASCLEASGGISTEIPNITMELSGRVERTPAGLQWRLAQRRMDESQEVVDATEYERLWLVDHGVQFGRSAGEKHFSRNGIPCTEWESPISFWTDDGRPNASTSQSQPVVGVMERSEDLVNWQEIGRMRFDEGQEVRMTDESRTGQMFYRIREAH